MVKTLLIESVIAMHNLCWKMAGVCRMGFAEKAWWSTTLNAKSLASHTLAKHNATSKQERRNTLMKCGR